ncbi:sensor histidine kinase [Solihabitans fulvus]|uniref:sensor histidine kinase n=1 Tax=Solihabitans fulvus TaxID=1892852 RepID=UPI001CB7680A|nr:nitrate- and nitrite sensing domain-containing protein [Solihabitans fulvus]
MPRRSARARGTGSLLRPRTIAGKLSRILVVSLAIVIALLTATILSGVRSYQAASDTSDAVSVTLTVQDLIHEVQRERGLTNGLLAGDTRFRADVQTQRGRTDNAVAALDRLIADQSVPGAVAVRSALDKLNGLAGVRGGVDAGHADRAATFKYYTDGVTALNVLNVGLDLAQDPELRHDLQALGALGDAKEATGQERGFLNGVFAAGHFGQDEFLRFTEIRANKQSALGQYAREATGDQKARLDGTLRSTAATQASTFEATALGGADGKTLERVDPLAWWAAMTTVVDQLRTVQQTVGDDIRRRAGDLQSQATMELLGFALLAGLAVLGEVSLVIGSARSIIRPLAWLSKEANDVASHRLPEAVAKLQQSPEQEPEAPAPVLVPARATDEIRSVTEALDRVQSTAFALASEQAVLRRNTTESLANLGRRNQNLVRRQLNFISDFEREELDPSALANLFELDHLATRMRRNAESLLVLVGESSPRRWAAPLPITDVIRAALSEVEDYRRVVLRRMDDAFITGSVVTEVAHLFAELIENGLSFSPPDLEVEIYGRRMGSSYLLAIIDYGVGMSADELEAANRRLSGAESFLVAPTRFLGHYVVGRLAKRLGVDVRLAESPAAGVTAKLVLPGSLLADPSAAVPSAEPGQGKAERRELVAARAATAQPSAVVDGPIVGDLRRPVRVDRVESTGSLPVTDGATARRQSRGEGGSGAANGAARPRRIPQEPAASSGPAHGESPGAQRPGGQERTRNGLVKRQPRSRAGAEPQPTVSRQAAVERPMEERSPSEVRNTLAAFRSGHQRGESQTTEGDSGDPASTAQHARRVREEGPRDR